MYEILLKWGLETLTKVGLSTESNDASIILEAIKTKNSLVIERFRYAYQTCESLTQLTIRLEEELREFQERAFEENKKIGKQRYINKIERDLHPKYYREYTKLRGLFDSTNDLLSGYSIVLEKWIQFENVRNIIKSRKCQTISDVSRNYRICWTLISTVMPKLLRITSNDLRFWLTDLPYVIPATEWARKEDLDILRGYIKLHEDDYFVSLERPGMLERFWGEIENS